MSAGAGRVGRKLRRAHAVGDLLADRPIDRVVVVGALGHVGERQAVIRLRLGVGRRGGGAAGNRQRVAGRGFVIVVAASRRRSDDCRADTNDRHLAGRGIDLCNRFIAAFIGNLAERLILVHSQLVREIRRANALAHRLGLIGNVLRSLGDGEHGRAGDRHAALGGLPIDCHRANVRQCNDIVGIRALTAGLVLDVHTLSGSRFDLDAVLLAVIGDGEAVRRGGEFVIQSIGLCLLTAVVTSKGDGKISVRGTDRIVRALHKLGAVVDHADVIKVRPCGSVVGIAIADTNDFDGLTAHILRSHSDSLRIQRLAVPREDDFLLTSLSVSQARAVQLGVAADSQRRGSNCGEEIRNRSGECAVGDLGRIQSNNASRISLIPQALSHLIRLEVKRVFTGYGRSSGVCYQSASRVITCASQFTAVSTIPDCCLRSIHVTDQTANIAGSC